MHVTPSGKKILHPVMKPDCLETVGWLERSCVYVQKVTAEGTDWPVRSEGGMSSGIVAS